MATSFGLLNSSSSFQKWPQKEDPLDYWDGQQKDWQAKILSRQNRTGRVVPVFSFSGTRVYTATAGKTWVIIFAFRSDVPTPITSEMRTVVRTKGSPTTGDATLSSPN